MYTLHFKEGLISFFLFTRFTILRIVYARVFRYTICARRTHMPMTSKDMERLILADGWPSGFAQAIQTPNEKR